MRVHATSIFLLLFITSVAVSQECGPRYTEYWQSYRTIEVKYPTGYAKSDVLKPGWAYAKHEVATYPALRACDSPYPQPGTWEKHNNSMANSTYRNWGEKKEPYSCERFLTKPCAPDATCSPEHICGTAPEAPNVTFQGGSGSDIYLQNSALIDDLKQMYCLPNHIIYRLKSRNDAAYQRLRHGGSPATGGMDAGNLASINKELVKLRSTCLNGAIR